VALVVRRTTRNYWARGLAWLHAFITAAVIVGTGNHWILDVLVGWALVIVAMWLVDPWFADQREKVRVQLAFNPQVASGVPERTLESSERAERGAPVERIEHIERIDADAPCPPSDYI